MNGPKKSEPAKIIATLNALNVGEMDLIRAKLDRARQDCLDLEQEELAARLGEASSALLKADLKTYRKRVESVISQLGHLK